MCLVDFHRRLPTPMACLGDGNLGPRQLSPHRQDPCQLHLTIVVATGTIRAYMKSAFSVSAKKIAGSEFCKSQAFPKLSLVPLILQWRSPKFQRDIGKVETTPNRSSIPT